MSRSLTQSHLQRPFFFIGRPFQVPGFGALPRLIGHWLHLSEALSELSSSTMFAPLQRFLHAGSYDLFSRGYSHTVPPSTHCLLARERGQLLITPSPNTADGPSK